MVNTIIAYMADVKSRREEVIESMTGKKPEPPAVPPVVPPVAATPPATPPPADPPAAVPPVAATPPPAAGDPPAAVPPVAATPPATPPPADPPPSPPAVAATPPVLDDDAAFIAAYNKRTGKDVKTMDEIIAPPAPLTDDQKAKLKEEEESQAIQFGLKNKLFTAKQLEQFNAEKAKSPREVMYSLFAAEEMKNDPTLTDEDVQERFKSYMMEDRAEDDWMRIRRTKEMESAVAGYLGNKYADITQAGEQFKHYNEVVQKATAYKGNIEKIFTDLPTTFTHTFKDDDGDQTFTFEYPKEVLKAVKDMYLHEDTFVHLNNGDVPQEHITAAIKTHLLEKTFAPIIEEFAKSYFAKKADGLKMGLKGIKPTGGEGGGGGQEPESTKITNTKATEIVEGIVGKK